MHSSLGYKPGSDDADSRFALKWRVRLLLLTSILVAIFGAFLFQRDTSPEAALESARAFLQIENFEAAIAKAKQAHSLQPHPGFLLVMAEAELRIGNRDKARSLLKQFEESEPLSIEQYEAGIRLAYSTGHATLYEQFLWKLVERDPDNNRALSRLIELLRIEGRNWELQRVLEKLMITGSYPLEGLFAAGCPERVWIDQQDRQFLNHWTQLNPAEKLPLFGKIIRTAKERNNVQEVIHDIEEILHQHPQQLEVVVQLGNLLLDNGRLNDLELLLSKYHSLEIEHPGIWVLRGRYLKQQGESRHAIRCFLEAAIRNPNQTEALYGLGIALKMNGEKELAKKFTVRADQLAELQHLILYGDGQGENVNISIMKNISSLLDQLDRPREAIGWILRAIEINPKSTWALDQLPQLKSKIVNSHQLTLPAGVLATDVQLRLFPNFDWSKVAAKRSSYPEEDSQHSQLSFADVASQSGIDFQFYNDSHPERGIARMYEFSGGGAAIIDYDSDLKPDIYLTQGRPWPFDEYTSYRDCLYRNSGTGQFEEIAENSSVDVRGYGQGCSVGDFDNDGMPDLYIGQIGQNKLLHNNGDGTFEDVTSSAGIMHRGWTLSTVIADFNNDGWADLYDVNYLTGNDLFTRRCFDTNVPVQCVPTMFHGQQDRLLLNRGDGTFVDATEVCGIVVDGGKGMGVIAADFFNEGRLSLFVANDTTANFFFKNTINSDVSGFEIPIPEFHELAVQNGLAYGELGNPQSCMGVAVGDVDSDTRLDLYVTNFVAEPNNLFVQKQPELFIDESAAFNLSAAVVSLMSWGTQFLDGDLDGDFDLIVANGHLANYGDEASRMPTQIFENQGSKFSVLSGDKLGRYFRGSRLGRSIARLDWNGDGREDFCVTHVDAPFALIENLTESSNHFLKVRLKGTQCSRDAIGSQIEIDVGAKTIRRHLTAGDGFSASNERVTIFGLGEINSINEIRVKWLSGEWCVFPGCLSDQEVIIIEGHQDLMTLKEDSP